LVARGAILVAKRFRHESAAREMRAMKTPTFVTFTMMLCWFAFYGTSDAAQQDAAHAAILAQSQAFTAALAQGDAGKAAQSFTADSRLSVPGIQGVLTGRAAIEKYWASALGGGLEELTLAATEIDGRGDLRVETGTYTAFGANRGELGRGQYLIVWKREDGAWKIHRDFGHADVATTAAGPSTDRVTFPADYTRKLRRVSDAVFNEKFGVSTVFANELAASAPGFSQGRYPNDSVIMMEFANPQRDGEGELLRDARGTPLKGEIVRIDVMRRGSGFGEAYGESRAGEWEFASYRPDGSTLTAPDKTAHCAACHRNAGADKDFVFRTRPWTPGH
jgi:ketosteroid isomerase-like protein